jgi:hypothetical protein
MVALLLAVKITQSRFHKIIMWQCIKQIEEPPLALPQLFAIKCSTSSSLIVKKERLFFNKRKCTKGTPLFLKGMSPWVNHTSSYLTYICVRSTIPAGNDWCDSLQRNTLIFFYFSLPQGHPTLLVINSVGACSALEPSISFFISFNQHAVCRSYGEFTVLFKLQSLEFVMSSHA